jgi:hypothetical protein
MFFGEIYHSIRGRIDCRQKIKPKSDRLLASKLADRANLTLGSAFEMITGSEEGPP